MRAAEEIARELRGAVLTLNRLLHEASVSGVEVEMHNNPASDPGLGEYFYGGTIRQDQLLVVDRISGNRSL